LVPRRRSVRRPGGRHLQVRRRTNSRYRCACQREFVRLRRCACQREFVRLCRCDATKSPVLLGLRTRQRAAVWHAPLLCATRERDAARVSAQVKGARFRRNRPRGALRANSVWGRVERARLWHISGGAHAWRGRALAHACDCMHYLTSADALGQHATMRAR
jgi:hypothetical protein